MTERAMLILAVVLTVFVIGFAVWAVVDQNNYADACEAAGGVAVIDWRGWNQCLEGVNK